MQWFPFICTECEPGLTCYHPDNYRKPILCIHSSIENLTDFLRQGKTETTCPTETTATASSTIICPPPPSTTTHSILLMFITVLILLVFFAQAFKMAIVARRLLKNRAIQKQLERRQKNMKTLRRQQAAAARQSSIVVRSVSSGLPSNQPIHQRQQVCTVPSHEVIYDVPCTGEDQQEGSEDSF
ncbi:hypothetical protein niasHS_000766 [Heterodera schachtii]|uniref:Uncharacterized protein n=1 Tax=Heterodera schachtii TaxID=97005 RepID=A0ABD2KLC9_HETSC